VHELARPPLDPGPPGHRVHGEIPPREILVERVRERDRRRMAVVGVVSLDTVGRDLDLVVALADDDGPEAVQVERVPKDLLDLLGGRAGRDVPVVRVYAAQRVANASTDDVSLMPSGDEARDHPLDVGGHLDVRNGAGHSRSLESAGDYIPR